MAREIPANQWRRRPLLGQAVAARGLRVVVEGDDACVITLDERGRARMVVAPPVRPADLASAIRHAASLCADRTVYGWNPAPVGGRPVRTSWMAPLWTAAGLVRAGDRLGLEGPVPPVPGSLPGGLRAAQVAEVDPLAEALRATRDPDTDWPELGEPDPAQLAGELLAAGGVGWIVWDGAEPVASAWIAAGPEHADVWWLGVRADRRRAGLARGVLALALAQAPDATVRTVVDARNPALRLFEGLGLRPVRRDEIWVVPRPSPTG